MSGNLLSRQQYTKFSPITVQTKKNMRALRLSAGHSMNAGARLFGVSRKQLEDLETLRNYGCHIDLEILAIAAMAHGTTISAIVGELEPDSYSTFYEWPRKRLGSQPR